MAGTIINTTSISEWGTLPQSVLPGQMLFHAGKGAIKMSLGNYTASAQISNDSNWATLSQLSGWGNDNTGTFFNNNGKLALTDALSFTINSQNTNQINAANFNVPLTINGETTTGYKLQPKIFDSLLSRKDLNDSQVRIGYVAGSEADSIANIRIAPSSSSNFICLQLRSISKDSSSTAAYGFTLEGTNINPTGNTINIGQSSRPFGELHVTSANIKSSLLATNIELMNSLAAKDTTLSGVLKVNNFYSTEDSDFQRMAFLTSDGYRQTLICSGKNFGSSDTWKDKQFGLAIGNTGNILPFYMTLSMGTKNPPKDEDGKRVALGSADNKFTKVYAQRFIGDLYFKNGTDGSDITTPAISIYRDIDNNGTRDQSTTISLQTTSYDDGSVWGLLLTNSTLRGRVSNSANLGTSSNAFNTAYINTLTVNTAINLPDDSIASSKIASISGDKITDETIAYNKLKFIDGTTAEGEGFTDGIEFVSSSLVGSLISSNLHRRTFGQLYDYFKKKDRTFSSVLNVSWSDFAHQMAQDDYIGCRIYDDSENLLDPKNSLISPQTFEMAVSNSGSRIHIRASWTTKKFKLYVQNGILQSNNILGGVQFFKINTRYLPNRYTNSSETYYSCCGSVKATGAGVIFSGVVPIQVSSSGYVLINFPLLNLTADAFRDTEFNNLQISLDYDLRTPLS